MRINYKKAITKFTLICMSYAALFISPVQIEAKGKEHKNDSCLYKSKRQIGPTYYFRWGLSYYLGNFLKEIQDTGKVVDQGSI
jgi:hypothetical protein